MHIFNLPWSIMWVTLPSCSWYKNSSQEPLFEVFKWCGQAASWLLWQVLHFSSTCLFIQAPTRPCYWVSVLSLSNPNAVCVRDLPLSRNFAGISNITQKDFRILSVCVRRTSVRYLFRGKKDLTLYKIETKENYHPKALTVHEFTKWRSRYQESNTSQYRGTWMDKMSTEQSVTFQCGNRICVTRVAFRSTR